MLIGPTGANKTYLGILESRSFAEHAEDIVNLRALYDLPTRDDAVEMVQNAAKAEENVLDGLTYIHVSLPGPARLAPDRNGMREKVRRTTATIANAYSTEFRRYLKENDTERDSVMRRQAETEMTSARSNYQQALNKWLAFVKSPGNAKALMYSGSERAANVARSSSAPSEIAALYQSRADIEQQIAAAKARNTATNDILRNSGKDMRNWPQEEPLLMEARAQVSTARELLDQRRISLAETHPQVVDAKKQLALAEQRLQEQATTILKGTTSDTIRMQALQASSDMVNRQIAEVEKNFQTGSEQAAQLQVLSYEVGLRLKVLETAASRYSELILSTVPAQNRMNIMDTALPPRFGKPGIGTILAVSLFMPLLIIGVWFVIEYVLSSSQSSSYASVKMGDRAPGSNGRRHLYPAGGVASRSSSLRKGFVSADNP
jgi:uncharacterized protein involved in exopolysaccharide biosynthesis